MKKKILIISALLIALCMLFALTNTVKATDDLKTTLNKVEEGTYTLNAPETINEQIEIKGKKTLDLNGKELTIAGGSTTPRLVVEEGASLTVKGNGKINVKEQARVLFDVKPGGTLILEDGEYNAEFGKNDQVGGRIIQIRGADGKKSEIRVEADATLTADVPIIIPDENNAKNINVDVYGELYSIQYSIYINGNVRNTTDNVPVINVYPGSVVACMDSVGPAVYAAGYGIWNISGGHFEGSEALSIKAGEFNITGGSFLATGEFVEKPEAKTGETTATGSAISITNNKDYAGSIVVNISNADVESFYGYAIFDYNTSESSPSVNLEITGGEFKGGKGAVSSQNATQFIRGGNFSGTVDPKYVSNDVQSEIEDGVTYVGEKYTIEVENTENGKVVSSKENAFAGQTVKLSATADEGYKLSSLKVYIKGAATEISVVNGEFVMPDNNVIVQARFEKVPEGESESITNPADKDNTPDTGSVNVVLIATVVAIITTAGIVVVKKYSK